MNTITAFSGGSSSDRRFCDAPDGGGRAARGECGQGTYIDHFNYAQQHSIQAPVSNLGYGILETEAKTDATGGRGAHSIQTVALRSFTLHTISYILYNIYYIVHTI